MKIWNMFFNLRMKFDDGFDSEPKISNIRIVLSRHQIALKKFIFSYLLMSFLL